MFNPCSHLSVIKFNGLSKSYSLHLHETHKFIPIKTNSVSFVNKISLYTKSSKKAFSSQVSFCRKPLLDINAYILLLTDRLLISFVKESCILSNAFTKP